MDNPPLASMQAPKGSFTLTLSNMAPRNYELQKSQRRKRAQLALLEAETVESGGEVQIPLFGGRIKVEDLTSAVARQKLPAVPGDWEWTDATSVYRWRREVIDGAARYSEMVSDGIFYEEHFDADSIHELYLHYPPARSIPLAGRRGELEKYVTWATPGENGRVFWLPPETRLPQGLLEKTTPALETITPRVSSATTRIFGLKGDLETVVLPILQGAISAVSQATMADHMILDIAQDTTVKLPGKLMMTGVKDNILLNGRLDTAVYRKLNTDPTVFSGEDLDSVLLVVTVNRTGSIAVLKHGDACMRHAIAQAYVVLEHRRLNARGFPNSEKVHFIVVNGEMFRFGCLTRDPTGQLLPSVSRIVQMDVNVRTGNVRNLQYILGCVIFILEEAISTACISG